MSAGRFRGMGLAGACLALTWMAWRLHRPNAGAFPGEAALSPVGSTSPPAVVHVPVEIFEPGKPPRRREVPVPPP